MATINFTGLASGIDSEALIKATSDATRAGKVTPNQNRVKELEDTNTAFSDLKAKLTTLQTLLRKFSTGYGGPLTKKATTTDETVLSGTATNAAYNGTYNVNVTSLASSATYTFGNTAKYSSASAQIGGGGPAKNDGDRYRSASGANGQY